LSSVLDGAAEHLAEALALARDSPTRAVLGLKLGVAHYYAGRHPAAIDALLGAIEQTGGTPALREQRLRLEAFLALAGRYHLETESRLRGRVQALAAELDGTTPGERLVRAIAAAENPGPTAHELYVTTAEGERAFEQLPWPDPAAGAGPLAMYLHAGRPDAAAALVERLLERARLQGSPLQHAVALACRGIVALDLGDLRAAQSDLEAALGLTADLGDVTFGPTGAGFYVQVLAWRGGLEAAQAVLDDYGLSGAVPEQMFFNPLLFHRGTLRMEQRRFADAEADFRELGRRHEQWGMTRPSPPWRSATALALIGQGRGDEARPLAAEELERARVWGTPKSIAFATRVLALTQGGEASIPGLAEAVERLEGTPWRLDRARARLELGAALRRSGRRRDGREALALAMDEAHASGAEPLAELAAEEMRASGARPRRRAISGLDALTPSERRVASLAAEGHTNREIAQQLFVTMATVETHLSRTYRKLDVDGREGLAAILSRA
jgi:DNA-binding CsgD family transcriptional regulator/tetratricopeptide (TPR) repeat protein